MFVVSFLEFFKKNRKISIYSVGKRLLYLSVLVVYNQPRKGLTPMDVRSYLEVAKPRLVLLLVFTSLASMRISANLNNISIITSIFLLGTVTALIGSAGCNFLTSYIDRDIDAVMTRTKNRPLPSGKIQPSKILYLGLVLISLSLVLARMRNILSFTCILLGIFDNVVVYSLMTKRRSSFNIILGGLSGGLAPLFGWVYVTNSVCVNSILISTLVILWIPSHIWALAIQYRTDYKNAKVPMLPVVSGVKTAIRCTASTIFLLLVVSIALFLNGTFGPFYLVISLISGFVVLAGNLFILIYPSPETAWNLFKISSPHLVILFLAMMIDLTMR